MTCHSGSHLQRAFGIRPLMPDTPRKHGWPFWFAVGVFSLPVFYLASIALIGVSEMFGLLPWPGEGALGKALQIYVIPFRAALEHTPESVLQPIRDIVKALTGRK
jgi:hypothetical protein